MEKELSSLRIVIDTNVILSHFISPQGTAGRAFDFIAEHCVYVICAETLSELIAKLSEDRFDRYGAPAERMRYVASVEEMAEFIDVQSNVRLSIDPKDDIFLSLALDGRADFIVTGDKKHLLPLNPFEGIPILSPADFLSRVGG